MLAPRGPAGSPRMLSGMAIGRPWATSRSITMPWVAIQGAVGRSRRAHGLMRFWYRWKTTVVRVSGERLW